MIVDLLDNCHQTGDFEIKNTIIYLLDIEFKNNNIVKTDKNINIPVNIIKFNHNNILLD